MEADDNRIETKTEGAKVIDLAAVREKKENDDANTFSLVKALRDPFGENAVLWIVAAIIVFYLVAVRR